MDLAIECMTTGFGQRGRRPEKENHHVEQSTTFLPRLSLFLFSCADLMALVSWTYQRSMAWEVYWTTTQGPPPSNERREGFVKTRQFASSENCMKNRTELTTTIPLSLPFAMARVPPSPPWSFFFFWPSRGGRNGPSSSEKGERRIKLTPNESERKRGEKERRGEKKNEQGRTDTVEGKSPKDEHAKRG